MLRKILIVDDQEDMLLVLEREFRRQPNLAVTSASQLVDALALVAEKQIDLVISDVRLGRESGFDLVRKINRAYPGVGSILISAYRSPGNRQQAQDLGVLLFLEKPFQMSQLIKGIESYFQQKENPAPAVAPPAPVAAADPASETPVTESSALSHFKIQDLVQLFCLNGRNILITVADQEIAEPGEIYIQRGRLIHANFNGNAGDEAFHALMRLSNPTLSVKDWMSPVPVTIEASWEHLLLQSAIETDQRENLDESLDTDQRRIQGRG